MQRVTSQMQLHLDYVQSELGGAPYLVGEQFSAADVQMSFLLEVARTQRAFLPEQHPGLFAWLQRLRARPAYQTALTRGGPYVYEK